MCSVPVEENDPPLFVVLNAAPEAIQFTLPKLPEYKEWIRLLDTTQVQQEGASYQSGTTDEAPARSVLAFAGAT